MIQVLVEESKVIYITGESHEVHNNCGDIFVTELGAVLTDVLKLVAEESRCRVDLWWRIIVMSNIV
jgi:hypothetical protein